MIRLFTVIYDINKIGSYVVPARSTKESSENYKILRSLKKTGDNVQILTVGGLSLYEEYQPCRTVTLEEAKCLV